MATPNKTQALAAIVKRHRNDIVEATQWSDTAGHPRSAVVADRFRSVAADRDYLRRTDYQVTLETFEREERRQASNGQRFGAEEAPSGVFCSHRLGAVAKLL